MKRFERDSKVNELEEDLKDLEFEKIKIEKSINETKKEIEKLKNMVVESESIKVVEITDDYIKFDNGYKITYDHSQECCEYNYADFKQLEDTGIENFVFKDLIFEEVKNAGFRFGDGRLMFFVPCYSEQNGYYSSDLDIYLNGVQMLNISCEEIYC